MTPLQITKFFNNKYPLILDGAIGSLLQQRGYNIDTDLWTSLININNPNVIIDIHKEYINSGCDIITTNTFRTNPNAINKNNSKIDANNIVKLSVELSKYVAKEYDVLLAGSNAPAEDCYKKERELSKDQLIYNHHKHIELLFSNDVDFILCETQSHLDEIDIICKYCSANSIPFVISLLVTMDLKILSGEYLVDVIKIINEYSPLLISINCINNNVFRNLLKKNELDFNWGFYLNCCKGTYTDHNIICELDENRYAEIVKSSLAFKPKLIGACCGSTPMHIKKIRELIYGTTNS